MLDCHQHLHACMYVYIRVHVCASWTQQYKPHDTAVKNFSKEALNSVGVEQNHSYCVVVGWTQNPSHKNTYCSSSFLSFLLLLWSQIYIPKCVFWKCCGKDTSRPGKNTDHSGIKTRLSQELLVLLYRGKILECLLHSVYYYRCHRLNIFSQSEKPSLNFPLHLIFLRSTVIPLPITATARNSASFIWELRSVIPG